MVLGACSSQLQALPRWKKVVLATATASVVFAAYKYCATKRKTSTQLYKATKIVACNNKNGECCLWDARNNLLCWLDIMGRKFWTFDPKAEEAKSYDLPEIAGSFCFIADCEDRLEEGCYLFAFQKGPAFYNIHRQTVSKRRIFDFEPEKRGLTRPNDGRVDRNGRFVFGGGMLLTMSGWALVDAANIIWLLMRGAHSKIYRVNRDLSHEVVVAGPIWVTNGICFSVDGRRMYYTDNLRFDEQYIRQLDNFEDSRTPSNSRDFATRAPMPGMRHK